MNVCHAWELTRCQYDADAVLCAKNYFEMDDSVARYHRHKRKFASLRTSIRTCMEHVNRRCLFVTENLIVAGRCCGVHFGFSVPMGATRIRGSILRTILAGVGLDVDIGTVPGTSQQARPRLLVLYSKYLL